MVLKDIEQNIEITRDIIRALNQEAFNLVEHYYIRVSDIRKGLAKKDKIGNVGIVKRFGKSKDEVYFYWGKFKKTKTTSGADPVKSSKKSGSSKYSKKSDSSKSSYFQKVYKKGGANVFTYKMSAFKNEPLKWEMELIYEFEPQLAVLREAMKRSRDALRYQEKAFNSVKKIFNKDEE